jgi:hypothetical protein
MKVKSHFLDRGSFKMGNGRKIRFWEGTSLLGKQLYSSGTPLSRATLLAHYEWFTRVRGVPLLFMVIVDTLPQTYQWRTTTRCATSRHP